MDKKEGRHVKLRRIYKPVLILIPFVLGMIGFTLAGEPVLQAVYRCIGLYGMGHSEMPANTLIEIARWLAPLATAGTVVLVANVLRQHFRVFVARCTRKSVGIYGPAAEKASLLNELGVRGVDMDQAAVKAHCYILLGSETENLEFYHRNKSILEGKDTYLQCSALPAQASSLANLHLFCPEEIAARFFWKKYCPYDASVQSGHRMKIVLLGFGRLGRELLLSALQNNIFDPEQRIEYHIFGSADGFPSVYHQLPSISDPVVFHEESWQNALPLLQEANMVIAAQQEDQLSLLRDLSLSVPEVTVHALVSHPDGAALLAAQAPLICYDWKAETLKLEHIVGSKLYLYAKRINLRYANLYEGAEETEVNRELFWQKLDPFTRYSNISAADYHDVQLRIQGDRPLTLESLELLAELEHIRWCRYHYLNNWTFGIPENGKNKDMTKRIHKLLVPYNQLADSEKEKDRENIRIMLELDKTT